MRAKYFENMQRLNREAESELDRQMRVMSESSKKKSAVESERHARLQAQEQRFRTKHEAIRAEKQRLTVEDPRRSL